MSKKLKNVCIILNYTEHFLILHWTLSYFTLNTLFYTEHFLIVASVITGFVSFSAFGFAVGLKISTIPVAIKKYESVIMKKKKKAW